MKNVFESIFIFFVFSINCKGFEIKSKFKFCRKTLCNNYEKTIVIPSEVTICTHDFLVAIKNGKSLQMCFLKGKNEIIEKSIPINCTMDEIRYDFDSFSAIRFQNKIKVIVNDALTVNDNQLNNQTLEIVENNLESKLIDVLEPMNTDDTNRVENVNLENFASALTISEIREKPIVKQLIKVAAKTIESNIEKQPILNRIIKQGILNSEMKVSDQIKPIKVIEQTKEVTEHSIGENSTLKIVVGAMSGVSFLLIVFLTLLLSKDKLRDVWIITKVYEFLTRKRNDEQKEDKEVEIVSEAKNYINKKITRQNKPKEEKYQHSKNSLAIKPITIEKFDSSFSDSYIYKDESSVETYNNVNELFTPKPPFSNRHNMFLNISSNKKNKIEKSKIKKIQASNKVPPKLPLECPPIRLAIENSQVITNNKTDLGRNDVEIFFKDDIVKNLIESKLAEIEIEKALNLEKEEQEKIKHRELIEQKEREAQAEIEKREIEMKTN